MIIIVTTLLLGLPPANAWSDVSFEDQHPELAEHTVAGQLLLPEGSGSRGVEILVFHEGARDDSGKVWVLFDEQGFFSHTFRGELTSLEVTAGIGAEVYRAADEELPQADQDGRIEVGAIDLRDQLERHRMKLRAAEGRPGGDVRVGMWFGTPPAGPQGESVSLGSRQFPPVALGSQVEWLLSPEAHSIYFLVERPADSRPGSRWRSGHQRLFGPFDASTIPSELVMD